MAVTRLSDPTPRMTLPRALLSEALRLARSPLAAVHLVCGLAAGLACGEYFSVARWDPALGADAYAFVDFLKKAGMSVWQVLPIGPTGYGESPYQSHGTHAGNINLIDLNFQVPSKKQAESACSHWAEKSQNIYATIMKELL